MLLAGGAIMYEPAAVVWHHHRADMQSLLKQMFGYGTGLTAFLTKLLMQPSTRSQVLRPGTGRGHQDRPDQALDRAAADRHRPGPGRRAAA